MDHLKMYFLLKMVIFQPAMLVYQRVAFSLGMVFASDICSISLQIAFAIQLRSSKSNIAHAEGGNMA